MKAHTRYLPSFQFKENWILHVCQIWYFSAIKNKEVIWKSRGERCDELGKYQCHQEDQ